MRLTTDRAVAVVGAVALALTGCDSRRAGTSGSGAGPAAGTTATAAGTSPREAAESLLKTLADGKLAPDQLTPYFRAVIAPPQTEDEKKAGYSDAQAREWLQGFSASKFSFLEESKFGNAVVERGRAESPAGKVAFTLRLVPDASGYKIDWLHRSTHIGLVPAPTDPDLADPQDAVRNFLDLLLGGDHRLVHALMTPALRKSLAPATPTDIRKGLDFDPGFLTQTTRAWKGEYVAYALPKTELGPKKDAATFAANLEAGGQSTPHTLKVVKDAGGHWLIDAFGK